MREAVSYPDHDGVYYISPNDFICEYNRESKHPLEISENSTKVEMKNSTTVSTDSEISLKSLWIEKETVDAPIIEVFNIKDDHVSVGYAGKASSMDYKITDFLRIYEPYETV